MAKRKYLSLAEWIEDKGVDYVASLLKVEHSTVRHWRRGHCLPKDDQKRAIKKLTKGLVGYDQILDTHQSVGQ